MTRHVITWAQNATPVHKGFLRALHTYCRHQHASLEVIPGRYQNPTSQWTAAAQDQEWWAPELALYLRSKRYAIGPHLNIQASVKIRPTAVRPLTGFDVFAGKASAVFGHPKVQLRTIPSGRREYPRILTTTGAVTLPNYTDSKAGEKAAQHHVIGALVVERHGDRFFCRHIQAAEDGSFTDLDMHYRPDGVEPAPQASFAVLGDIHVDVSDPEVLAATFGPEGLLALLEPEEVYLHDVLHFARRSHHNRQSFRHAYDTHFGDTGKSACVRTEVMDAIRFIDEKIPPACRAVVVASNHDDAFDRWLAETDFRKDPANSEFFVEVWRHVLLQRRLRKEWVPAFELCYDLFSERGEAEFLRRDQRRERGGTLLHFHGDVGTHGSRGSTRAYAHLGFPTVTGHSHVPEIYNGAYVVGVTGSLDQGYNRDPSAWAHAHCVQYASGARALIFVIDGMFRRPD